MFLFCWLACGNNTICYKHLLIKVYHFKFGAMPYVFICNKGSGVGFMSTTNCLATKYRSRRCSWRLSRKHHRWDSATCTTAVCDPDIICDRMAMLVFMFFTFKKFFRKVNYKKYIDCKNLTVGPLLSGCIGEEVARLHRSWRSRYVSFVSIIIVIGPSFTKATFMSAPKVPVCIFLPNIFSSFVIKASYKGTATEGLLAFM